MIPFVRRFAGSSYPRNFRSINKNILKNEIWKDIINSNRKKLGIKTKEK